MQEPIKKRKKLAIPSDFIAECANSSSTFDGHMHTILHHSDANTRFLGGKCHGILIFFTNR